MKIGVVGFGSIGRRHCENLLSLGEQQIGLLREKGNDNSLGLNEYTDSHKFFAEKWDAIILSNPTSQHFNFLYEKISPTTACLIEKPVVANREEWTKLSQKFPESPAYWMLAMNMRFHPAFEVIEEFLKKQGLGRVHSARFFVGQYLPDWRPSQDYRQSYSAKKNLGGGVVLDLIHEIDLALRFFGAPSEPLKSICLQTGSLDIETEDLAECIYLGQKRELISIHLDYLARSYERKLEIYGSMGALSCDWATGKVEVKSADGSVQVLRPEGFDRNAMYVSELKYFLSSLLEKRPLRPNLKEGLDALDMALKIKNL